MFWKSNIIFSSHLTFGFCPCCLFLRDWHTCKIGIHELNQKIFHNLILLPPKFLPHISLNTFLRYTVMTLGLHSDDSWPFLSHGRYLVNTHSIFLIYRTPKRWTKAVVWETDLQISSFWDYFQDTTLFCDSQILLKLWGKLKSIKTRNTARFQLYQRTFSFSLLQWSQLLYKDTCI